MANDMCKFMFLEENCHFPDIWSERCDLIDIYINMCLCTKHKVNAFINNFSLMLKIPSGLGDCASAYLYCERFYFF